MKRSTSWCGPRRARRALEDVEAPAPPPPGPPPFAVGEVGDLRGAVADRSARSGGRDDHAVGRSRRNRPTPASMPRRPGSSRPPPRPRRGSSRFFEARDRFRTSTDAAAHAPAAPAIPARRPALGRSRVCLRSRGAPRAHRATASRPRATPRRWRCRLTAHARDSLPALWYLRALPLEPAATTLRDADQRGRPQHEGRRSPSGRRETIDAFGGRSRRFRVEPRLTHARAAAAGGRGHDLDQRRRAARAAGRRHRGRIRPRATEASRLPSVIETQALGKVYGREALRAPRSDAQGRERRVRLPDRPERRRQEHAAAACC